MAASEDAVRVAIAKRIKAVVTANAWGSLVLEYEPEDPRQLLRPNPANVHGFPGYDSWTVDAGNATWENQLRLSRKSGGQPAAFEFAWTHTIRYRLQRNQQIVKRPAVLARMIAVVKDLIARPSLRETAGSAAVTENIWLPPVVSGPVDDEYDGDPIHYTECTIGFTQSELLTQL